MKFGLTTSGLLMRASIAHHQGGLGCAIEIKMAPNNHGSPSFHARPYARLLIGHLRVQMQHLTDLFVEQYAHLMSVGLAGAMLKPRLRWLMISGQNGACHD